MHMINCSDFDEVYQDLNINNWNQVKLIQKLLQSKDDIFTPKVDFAKHMPKLLSLHLISYKRQQNNQKDVYRWWMHDQFPEALCILECNVVSLDVFVLVILEVKVTNFVLFRVDCTQDGYQIVQKENVGDIQMEYEHAIVDKLNLVFNVSYVCS